jgi:hypothetical protein
MEILAAFQISINTDQHDIPEAIWFLHWGWWIIHLVGIPLVFGLGYLAAKRCCAGKAAGQ